MFKRFHFVTIVFSFVSIFAVQAQNEGKPISSEEFQKELNEGYANPETSPLDKEDLKDFKELEFYEIDPDYVVQASFVRTPMESPFTMKTSTDREPVYVKYGEVYFTLKGKEYQLNVYQGLELQKDPDYYDYLFLPFTDLTNGRTTYGNGRYLDLRIPESDSIELDFNKAYNPYCAYSSKYSCPIPPAENDLDTEILAGVQAYDKH
ncbi:DUF1684 domain-containing protein [Christiangramia flava]|uniref:Uncharacterized protein n=1 Tax=Christiangramia flava JLT2011 TaxID=1229726 RepID=A0A1L7I774_9FLAO|nr:DUF1684 domain-containing protein [Christiangramia flava]APU69043.1 hypothetical protein GRFL_2319 [Christiangramia flava JLT2011]OSS38356.1 hypothetical protein C723_2840 [Christiangramia flava JLT2011]